MQHRPYRDRGASRRAANLRARPVADYASRDSSDSKRTYAPVDQSTKPLGTSNGDVSKINRNSSHDLAVIGVRLLDDAHMTWVAAEFESEHAL
jgi:hypothetical protein